MTTPTPSTKTTLASIAAIAALIGTLPDPHLWSIDVGWRRADVLGAGTHTILTTHDRATFDRLVGDDADRLYSHWYSDRPEQREVYASIGDRVWLATIEERHSR